MSYANPAASARPGTLRRIVARATGTLTWLINIRPLLDQAERLARQSDADLSAKGTSRGAEIVRIFGPRAHY